MDITEILAIADAAISGAQQLATLYNDVKDTISAGDKATLDAKIATLDSTVDSMQTKLDAELDADSKLT